MHRDAVQSSMIRGIGYDRRQKVLEVEFANGQVFAYRDVPEETHIRVMAAASIGKEFSALVRNAFAFERVEG